jgi:pyrroloquinoline quinone (PQQ) biosynthesis protein C
MNEVETRFPTFDSFKVWFDDKTRDHPLKNGRWGPFKEDFAEGRVPLHLLKEYGKQLYIHIQLTNVYTSWLLVSLGGLWLKHPDLYDIIAAKMGSELADPKPGGHGRTYVKFAHSIGLTDEDLFYAKPALDTEARLNRFVNRAPSPALTAVDWMLEGLVGHFMKVNREILHEKYGLADDVLEYFDIHIQADLEEHGPEGAMLLERLYKLGLVTEDDYPVMRARVERAIQGW